MIQSEKIGKIRKISAERIKMGMTFYALGAALSVALSLVITISDAYFHSRRASCVRLAFSIAFFICGIGLTIGSLVMFYNFAPDASNYDWAENAFSMFARFSLLASVIITLVLASAAAISHKMRIVRAAISVVYPVGMILLGALFAALSTDSEVYVQNYVYALALGESLFSLVSPLIGNALFVADKTDKSCKNNKKEKHK